MKWEKGLLKVCVNLPVDRAEHGPFLSASGIAHVAQAAERAGFHAVSVSDHPCPTGDWLDSGGHHAQDPFVVLAFAAAATHRIRLQTGILVLPYRNPFIVARAVNTLDALCAGRVLLGVATGYLEGEYRALGADHARRNELVDEYILALKAAWSADEFSFRGTGYEAVRARILPRPVQQPHPPILVGGNSNRAIRRAAELGTAWNPARMTPPPAGAPSRQTPTLATEGELIEKIAYLDAHCEKIGRAERPEILLAGVARLHADWNAAELTERLGRLAVLGIGAVRIDIEAETVAAWCEEAERFGVEVIARL